ncbi:GPW/gp25 family protein [Desulfofundulus thermosubterraneus]|uniref:Gene 25-like lysozyme n=1 Tax=Desulfofundulus thermosubterraneus DSM 16057 TaxID=1121432 RepID=A0A1M6M9N6_9FIRM|nr:GPW/gp25 family protein [Desulfofundulus thermosubterraneus]SHJ80134.1 Gene 25-like lysozyme [Desulfofundulus thermosubterraneus DSM 16057]
MSLLGSDLSGEVNLRGDFGCITGLANLEAAIKRRLATPKGALFSHPEYGNPAWELIGENIDEVWVGRVCAALQECLEQEPRIRAIKITPYLYEGERLIRFNIAYQVISEQTAANLVWEVPLSGLS